MRSLIVEDDPTSRKILHKVLSAFGPCDLTADGRQAVEVFRRSLDACEPFDLICMDIMMPEIDGNEALERIRQIEKQAGVPAADEVKVIMTTALSSTREITDALFKGGACAYFVKPLQIDSLIRELRHINLIPE